MRIYKKSHNPYFNLIKSISYLYQDVDKDISEKLTQYKVVFDIFKDDLNKYKFYIHPSFNDKWDKNITKNIKISNVLKMKNPWHLFIYNFVHILNSTYFDDQTKYNNITKELAWFDNTFRVQDWVIVKSMRKQKHA